MGFHIYSARAIALAKSAVTAGLIASAVAFAAVGALPSVAQAASPTPAAAQQQRVKDRLARLLQREQNLLTNQQTRLDKSGDAVTKAQQYIADQKAKGQDTAKLESALATFQQAVATAKTNHDAAAAALSAKAGFDANGQVTDVAQARTTLRTAGQAERLFHLTMRQATIDLQTAIREYRLTNRPTPAPAPTATPSGA